jgi:ABC-type nitrate/sulfonate/bicarbonate transport system substrate-binding protein
MNRWTNTFLAAGLAATLAVAGASTAGAADKIRVGMLKPNLVTVLYWIAVKDGAFARNGLDVEEHPVPSGQSVAGVEQTLSGDLDFYFGSAGEVAHANSQSLLLNQGAPLSVIEGTATGVMSIVLKNDLKGKTLEQLKSMPLRIGVSSPSSTYLAMLRGALPDLGVNPSDLKWQWITVKGGNMPPALLSGQLDGFMHSEPTTTLALNSGAGFVFMNARKGDLGKAAQAAPVTFIIANKTYIKAHPDIVRRFVKALHEANAFYDKTPKDKMMVIIAEWAKQDPKVMSGVYERLDPRADMDKAGADAWWNLIGGAMRTRGSISDKLKFDDMFDLSYRSE